MHIVIMGCGRTGAALATEFEGRGHSVAVIDQAGDAFRRLPASFQGQKITGIGFDRDTLVSAGVEEAYGFAAVSDGDNSNILAARVVRETYGVQNVVARIADPGRAEVYQRLGISTVAPVSWTSRQIMARILPAGSEEAYVDASSQMVMKRFAPHVGWVGLAYRELERRLGVSVAYVVRFGAGVVPSEDTLVQDGDEPYLVYPPAQGAAVDRALGRAPSAAAPAATRRPRAKGGRVR